MTDAISARYRRFAEVEARGRSELYERLALAVAGDVDVLGFLAGLPPARQQPNLLFASVRHLFGVLDWADFRDAVLDHADALRAVILARSTQTNEPGRCAVLLPVLARLPQPLALVEVGASAGLCLLPDRYGYDYGGTRLGAGGDGVPVFPCVAEGDVPLPGAMPRIVWRAGLDLNPIDPADPEQAAWLETLVWPEQEGRRARLRAALLIAAAERVRIAQGDLLGEGLARLCAEAPAGATLVVFHSAVLAYVAEQAARERFAARVTGLCPYWISNEAPGVFPAVAARAGDGATGRFLLAVNGEPTAWTDPHGAGMAWIGGA